MWLCAHAQALFADDELSAVGQAGIKPSSRDGPAMFTQEFP
jgi:hypothetical protein